MKESTQQSESRMPASANVQLTDASELAITAAQAGGALLSLPVVTEDVLKVAGPGTAGRDYWRSLEEYADSESFNELLGQEFPGYDPDQIRTLSRRRFMQLAAASMALAGITLTGCRRWPQEKLAPFAVRPEGRIPGKSQKFATMMQRGGISQGLLATSVDGRPIKLSGNPKHPTSLGATDIFAQAEILELYNPHRLPFPRQKQPDGSFRQAGWEAFQRYVREGIEPLAEQNGGESLLILSEADAGPSMEHMKKKLREKFPNLKWATYEPISRDNSLEGAKLAFGKALRPQYQLDQTWCIAAFDSDLLLDDPSALRNARGWSANRKKCDEGRMNRMYVVESRFSTTGSVADHRLPVTSKQVGRTLLALAQRLGVPGVPSQNVYLNGSATFVDVLAEDLKANAGQSLVTIGERQPAYVHVLGWMINQHLGNIGKTVTFIEEPALDDQDVSFAQAVQAMKDGQVSHVLMLGCNPVYDAPVDSGFNEALAKVSDRIHLSLMEDETTLQSTWSLPKAHFLECWADGRAWDGTLSIQQPLILPLFEGRGSRDQSAGGRNALEVLDMLVRRRPRGSWDIVRQAWTEQGLLKGENTFEADWRTSLHEGLVESSASSTVSVQLRSNVSQHVAPLTQADASEASGSLFEVNFYADNSVYDGRYANNGWLQEVPGDMTKLTWDNVALMNVTDANRLGVNTGSMIEITLSGQSKSLRIPVMVQPGQAKGAISLSLGYGRTAGGPVAEGVGFNTYSIRTSENPYIAQADVTRSIGRHRLAFTQNHHLLDGVAAPTSATESAAWALKKRLGKVGKSGYVVKESSLANYLDNPGFVRDKDHGDVSLQLYNPPYKTPEKRPGGPTAFNNPHAWGMTLDMTACIGCNACVVSCQAENNIPIVGKEQVLVSREMHWLRIDRYFKGDPAGSPDVVHQPVTCVQCENAPCEQVCPVAATVHDTEGLNTMVYNRCIGTRYCSNNCPYKVRRFNYLDYHSLKRPGKWPKPWLDWPDQQQLKTITPIERMKFNPEVTVRMRGVMEKCTYCTQRIQEAKSDARIRASRNPGDSGLVQDGDVMTACQEVCPTQAISFGDLNDAKSQVTKHQELNRAYDLLAELNSRPRTKHLALIRNKNPKLDPDAYKAKPEQTYEPTA